MSEQPRFSEEEIEQFNQSRAEVSKGDNKEHDRARAMAEAEAPHRDSIELAKKLGVTEEYQIDMIRENAESAAKNAAEEYDQAESEKRLEERAYQDYADSLIREALAKGTSSIRGVDGVMAENHSFDLDYEKLYDILKDRVYERLDENTLQQKVPGFDVVANRRTNLLGLRYEA